MADVDRILGGEQIREDKSGFEATIRQLVIETVRNLPTWTKPKDFWPAREGNN